MWKNFLVVTLRSIKKHMLFNLINIAGLAIGLASAIFIILYIISESGYDRFHERSADIYRICLDGKSNGLFFSLLAIFIASSGLFGLSLYNAQKRIREIGIRKVLGATETGIILMVSKSVASAVVISIGIALPAAYFITKNWLQDFPYNVGFTPVLFIVAALLVVIIALVTVSLTSLKAARTNPAICLHYE